MPSFSNSLPSKLLATCQVVQSQMAEEWRQIMSQLGFQTCKLTNIIVSNKQALQPCQATSRPLERQLLMAPSRQLCQSQEAMEVKFTTDLVDATLVPLQSNSALMSPSKNSYQMFSTKEMEATLVEVAKVEEIQHSSSTCQIFPIRGLTDVLLPRHQTYLRRQTYRKIVTRSRRTLGLPEQAEHPKCRVTR